MTEIDPREVDALYRPFPSFAEWGGKDLHTETWTEQKRRIKLLRRASPEVFRASQEVVERAAAFDTGAIEGLYNTDGFTITVALEGAALSSVTSEKGDDVKASVEAQLKALQHVLDLATGTVPIGEAWIRALHEKMCEAQHTYRVMTPVGWQEQPLPKGSYKTMPNHVKDRYGGIHAWAPVSDVPLEMHRLVEELKSEVFLQAHAVVQAAYSHYAFVSIHPFADGNGRVARALASIYTYKGLSIPLLIFDDRKKQYLDALHQTDGGNHQALTDFLSRCSVEAIGLFEMAVDAGAQPSPEAIRRQVIDLYTSEHGITYKDLDGVSLRLQAEVAEAFSRARSVVSVPGLEIRVAPAAGGTERAPPPGFQPSSLQITLSAVTEAPLRTKTHFRVGITREGGMVPTIRFAVLPDGVEEPLVFPLEDLRPTTSTAASMRLRIWAEKHVRRIASEAAAKARALSPQS